MKGIEGGLPLIIGYTIFVAILLAFIIIVILANKNVIFRKQSWAKKIFGNPLLYYTLKRCGSALISLSLAIVVTFCLLRVQDSNYFCLAFKNKVPPAMYETMCENKLATLGLNDPLIVQLFRFFGQIAPFPKEICLNEKLDKVQWVMRCVKSDWVLVDLGVAYKIGTAGKQISEILAEKMPISFEIGALGVIIEMLLGYPLGVFMAKYKDKFIDRLGNGYIIFVFSIPGLVFYYFFYAIFCKGMGMPLRYEEGNFISMLPAILTFGLSGLAGIALWVRRFMVDELNSDYVRFARAKGIPENKILFKHILRNAVVPIIRMIPGAILGALLGSFFIEKIYAIPGFGNLLIDSINQSDYAVTQAVVVVSAVISIVSALLGDIMTALADPRVSFSSDN